METIPRTAFTQQENAILSGISEATKPTGNALADLYLAQSAIEQVNAANKAQTLAQATLATASAVSSPNPKTNSQVQAKVLISTAKTAKLLLKAGALTATALGVSALAISPLAPTACATSALAGGVVCEAVLPSAVAINTVLYSAGAALLASATPIYTVLKESILGKEEDRTLSANFRDYCLPADDVICAAPEAEEASNLLYYVAGGVSALAGTGAAARALYTRATQT